MSIRRNVSPTVRAYLGYMLRSPVSIWWACATFALEAMGFLIVSPSITISRLWLVPILFIISFSLFVGLLVLYKGWSLYSDTFEKISVTQVVRVENEQVFLLHCHRNIETGSILELHRKIESVELPIGLIMVTSQNEEGIIQATAVWIMAGHLREMELNQLSTENLTIKSIPSKDILSRWIDGEAENRVQELLKRGKE